MVIAEANGWKQDSAGWYHPDGRVGWFETSSNESCVTTSWREARRNDRELLKTHPSGWKVRYFFVELKQRTSKTVMHFANNNDDNQHYSKMLEGGTMMTAGWAGMKIYQLKRMVWQLPSPHEDFLCRLFKSAILDI